jgi:hypothetical protein
MREAKEAFVPPYSELFIIRTSLTENATMDGRMIVSAEINKVVR